jgi:tyrosinase
LTNFTMRISIAALSAVTLVSGAAIKREDAPASVPMTQLYPALPVSLFEKTAGHTLTLEEALAGLNITDKIRDLADHLAGQAENIADKVEDGIGNFIKPIHRGNVARATCSSVRVRTEWHSTSDTEKQNFVSSLKCLMGKAPSGQFAASKSRYEDFVALHQILTPRVHQSSKFLLWHRYYLWTFEQVLRDDCGLTTTFPWFDETKYAGKFSQSSIFSSQWMGAISLGGNCVTDGVSLSSF